MKKILSVLLILVLAVVSGCGGSSSKPGPAALSQGEYLYQALGDENLEEIDSTLPKSVTVKYADNNGTNTAMSSDRDAIRALSKLFTNIKIGSSKPTSQDKGDREITFSWSDGEQSVISFKGSDLVYKSGSSKTYYSLTGFDEFWDAAVQLGSYESGDVLIDAICSEQGFATKSPADAELKWDEEAGFYIGLKGSTSIPYVLIYRYRDFSYDAEGYFTEIRIPDMEESYGDDMISISAMEPLSVTMADGSKMDMYTVEFVYESNGNEITAIHVAGDFGNDLVTFIAKYADDSDKELTTKALETAMANFRIGGAVQPETQAPSPEPVTGTPAPGGENFTIVPSKAASVKYEYYDNYLITAEIPEGWVVNVFEYSDYVHYTFQIYDPDEPYRRIYFNMKSEGYFSSEAEYRYFVSYYPDTIFSGLPWIDPQTTEQFCKNFTQAMGVNSTRYFSFPTINNFSFTESYGKDPFGQETIRGNFTNEKGEKIDGVFSCNIVPEWLYIATALNVYQTTFVMAPDGELPDWLDVFSHVLGSIRFTQYFMDNYADEIAFQARARAQIAQICTEMTDLVISGWESQQSAYDRISQKQRDATMGYERVYDTDTGDIYEAPLDFFDYYHGGRYQPVTDNMYNLPIAGYIEWK